MQTRTQADAIDTRLVFRIYAAVALLAGFVLAGWGPMWLRSQTASRAALIRVMGASLIAAGCFAVPLAKVDDPAARRQGLFWYAAGHSAVLVFVLLQGGSIWGRGFADIAAVVLNTVVILFVYLATSAEGEAVRPGASFLSLFGTAPSTTERLRSQYEHQIREAARQEERNRLARDLHDSIKQQIFVMQTAAATAQVRFDEDPNGAKSALVQVRSSAREAITEMEAMLDQLRAAPLENVGLVEALKKQCEALGFRTGAQVELKLGKLPPSHALAPGAQEALFRVAQEALANVARHARASRVLVILDSVYDRVELRVQDDGAGFDPGQAPAGMGIANMRARATEFGGEFELESKPGAGTTIKVSVPCTVHVRTAEDYRTRAAAWGGALVLFIVCSVWTPDPLQIAITVVAALGFTREAVAWLRTRKAAQ